MAKGEVPRIAVLGAGPVGLEAALYARTLNLPVTVHDRGHVGEYGRRCGPFGMNSPPLGWDALRTEAPRRELPADGDFLTGKEHLAAYLEPLAKAGPLRDCRRTETQVVQVGRRGFLKGDGVGDPKRG